LVFESSQDIATHPGDVWSKRQSNVRGSATAAAITGGGVGDLDAAFFAGGEVLSSFAVFAFACGFGLGFPGDFFAAFAGFCLAGAFVWTLAGVFFAGALAFFFAILRPPIFYSTRTFTKRKPICLVRVFSA
jgi:hypothetical protein